MRAGKDCGRTAANAGWKARIAYHFAMDLRNLRPIVGIGMRVAEPGAQPMISDACPTRTDTAAARRAGFTIMELMIVLVIVGIMAMTVAPSLSEVLGTNRHANAAMDLMRFMRRARSQSIATGKAQLIRFQTAGANRLGRIDVLTGISNRCRQTPWAAAIARPVNRSMAFDMTDYNPSAIGSKPGLDDTGRPLIVLTAHVPAVGADPLSEVRLCYQPDGLVYRGWDPDPTLLRIQDLAVEFRLRRQLDGARHGEDRFVALPPGGNARLQ
jgi:prepilin-type N-terminal cleavage/methylation domain-containing protein